MIMNKNLMKKIFFVLFIFSFLFLINLKVSFADFDIKKWRHEKEIKIGGEISYQTYTLFPFDEEVFRNANPNLSDIRIIAN